jgi:hypothetical protein
LHCSTHAWLTAGEKEVKRPQEQAHFFLSLQVSLIQNCPQVTSAIGVIF